MAEQISYSGTAGFDYDGFDNWKLSDYPEGYVCPNPGTSVNCYTGGCAPCVRSGIARLAPTACSAGSTAQIHPSKSKMAK